MRVRIALLSVLGTFLLLSLIGLALPKRAEVERSRVIEAPPERIHAELIDLRNWESWHPMFRNPAESGLTVEYGESTSGVGGQMLLRFGTRFQVLFTIVVSDPERGVEIELHAGAQDLDLWRREDTSPSLESIRFERVVEGTRITWIQTGAESDLLLQRTLEALLVRRRIGKQIDGALEGLHGRIVPGAISETD